MNTIQTLLNNISYLFFQTILNDAPEPFQIGFQDGASPSYTGIVALHDSIFFYLVLICVSVFWVLGTIVYSYSSTNNPIAHKYLNHGRFVPFQKCLNSKNLLKKYKIYT